MKFNARTKMQIIGLIFAYPQTVLKETLSLISVQQKHNSRMTFSLDLDRFSLFKIRSFNSMQEQIRNPNTEEIKSILILELMKENKNHHNKKDKIRI